MTTDSTEGVLEILRTRLLTFAPMGGGDTLQVRLGGRLYQVQAPDSAVYPYGIMRLLSPTTSGNSHGERKQGDLEVMLYDRPRAKARALEASADVCDQAMLRFIYSADDGLLFSKTSRRDTLPPFQDPADREVVMIRLVYGVVFWPRYLFQYAQSTP